LKELAEILQGLVEYGGTTAAVADLKDCDPKETLLHEVEVLPISLAYYGNPDLSFKFSGILQQCLHHSGIN